MGLTGYAFITPSFALGRKKVVSPASNSSFRYIRNVKRDDCFASGGEESYMYLSCASIDEGGHAPSVKLLVTRGFYELEL